MTIREIPLNKLVLSPNNMRKGDIKDPETGVGQVDVSDLLVSFRARRTAKQSVVLQNLRVTEELSEAGKPTGRFAVHVGGRRYRALEYLAALKELPKTFAVPCMVCDSEAHALEESIEENMARLDPHPAARFKAFKALVDEGRTVAEVAERFNTTENMVARRLKLAMVSPRIFELFERDEVTIEQMQALTLSDDHELQEKAYFDFPSKSAHELRRRLVEGERQTRNYSLFQFVGADAYKAAGGFIRQDLFANDDEGYVGDHALVEKLAIERLEAEAEAVRAEGWKWVEVRTELSYTDTEKFGRVYPTDKPLSAEALARIEAINAELEELSNEEETEENTARFMELEGELSEAEQTEEEYTAESMALAGAIVTVTSYNGELKVERGLVKPEDTKAMKAMVREAEGNGETVETKTGAGQSNRRADGLPAALVEDLTARRTLAIRKLMMDNPKVALVALVHRLALLTFYTRNSFGGTLASAVVIDGGTYNHNVFKHGEGLDNYEPAVAMEGRKGSIKYDLPEKPENLWAYLAQADEADLMRIMAYCTASQVYAVDLGFSADQRRRNSHEMADALGLDMADFWSPTSAFFKRIPREEIMRAMTEGAEVVETPDLAKLKKGELAERAEQVLAGKRWVPEVLRTPPLEPVLSAAADDEPAQDEHGFEGDEALDDEEARFDDEGDDEAFDDGEQLDAA